MRGLARLVGRHRRRLASAVALVGLAALGLTLGSAVPRQTELEFALGPDHAQVVEVRVAYVQDGEELYGVSFGFPEGAPPRVRHRIDLPPGRFEVRLELRRRDAPPFSFVHTVVTPVDGVAHLYLGEGRS